MSKKYFEHLFWAKYGMITVVLGVLVGLVGYRNLTETPFSVLHAPHVAIDLKPSSEFATVASEKTEIRLYMKRSDARSH